MLPIVFWTANVGTFVFCGVQPVQPIGVNSDSTAVSLYRADDSTGSAAFTGLAGEVASVISEPAANAKRTIMERDFFVMCQIYTQIPPKERPRYACAQGKGPIPVEPLLVLEPKTRTKNVL